MHRRVDTHRRDMAGVCDLNIVPRRRVEESSQDKRHMQDDVTAALKVDGIDEINGKRYGQLFEPHAQCSSNNLANCSYK